MSTDTGPRHGFIDHTEDDFVRTYHLLDALCTVLPANSQGAHRDLFIDFAFGAFTDNGRHRPAADHELSPYAVEVPDEPLIEINVLVRDQLDAATDLDTALRLRRTRAHLLEAMELHP